jgi:hypothetical protein
LYDPNNVPQQPNKVSFSGTVCTDNPAERSFPLRVVFLVDDGANMPFPPADSSDISAYQGHLVQAVRDELSILRAPDASFALIRYGGQSNITPDGGFTSNSQDISTAAGAITVPIPPSTDGSRRLGQALSLASSLITGDELSTARGPRSRTKYVIVVVQGGPTDDIELQKSTTPTCDEACTLQTRVQQLRDDVLADGAADFQLHTLDLSELSAQTDPATGVFDFSETKPELQDMAFAGAGEYKPVCVRDPGTGQPTSGSCAPNSFSLTSISINSARNVFLEKSFIVSNLSARPSDHGEVADSDEDGLSDEEEALYGTDPTKRDTDGDGIGDKVEVLLSTVGLDPLVPDNPGTCSNIDPTQVKTLDSDGDGLTDCEEELLRLDPTLFDTDGDGSPDLLEVMYGTNFLQDDSLTDSDFDGTPNNVELKQHSDPRSADPKTQAEDAYIYQEIDEGIKDILFATQPHTITGVTVNDVNSGTTLGNGELSYTLAGGNKLVLAWKDPSETTFGDGVVIPNDGTYVLPAACEKKTPDCKRDITVAVIKSLLPPFSADEFLLVDQAQKQCTKFRVRNVTLVETKAADGRKKGFNDVRIYYGEVPASEPNAFGIFRVAQFPFTFIKPDHKDPNIAEQVVDDFRFVLFE